jgi:sugar phosphate isomerase/epimerase
MKTRLPLLIILFFTTPFAFGQSNKAEAVGWKLSAQAFTFNRYTFVETVEKMHGLGLKHMEIYFGQVLGEGFEGRMRYTLEAEDREKIKKLLAEKQIRLVNCGVISCKTEEDWRNLFAFASDMGIETINSEPDPLFMDLLDALTTEYGINLAIHNHPKPSRYWDPQVVLATLGDRKNPRLGDCADVGHWIRSGLDPIECLKQLEGRVLSLHFKDLHEKGPKGHDVPWGTGISNVEGILHELKRQQFRGVFSIEYEHNWTTSVPEIAQSIAYFQEITNKIL